jgi:hypothetical protein
MPQILAATQAGAPEPSSATGSASIPPSHMLEANSEVLWSSGITLTDSSVAYRQTRNNSDLNLNLSFGTIDLAYQPADFDIISQAADLREARFAVQAGLKQKVAPSLTLLGSGGVYDGYVNYRTLWLNEYYQQYYSDVRGYSAVHPRGFNVSAGLRWEFRPATAFLQIEGIYSRDDVPSGYEIVVRPPPQIGAELHRSPDRLHTGGARVSLENVLTRRIRLLNEFLAAATTDRDPRFSYQGSLNWALAEQWVLRSVAGFSMENPNFHAYAFAATLERDWEQKWFVSLFGRYYKDNGEIDNPQLFNVAAPALETVQVGLGVRWQGERCSVKLVAGPYITRYDSVEADIKPFEKLYRGRDWGLAQASVTYSF